MQRSKATTHAGLPPSDRLLNRLADLLVRPNELVDGRFIEAFERNNNQAEEETFDRGEQIPNRFDHKNVHRRDDLAAR